ncbi:MAG: sulfate adenylyltransferase, partial [Armatimonadetes bacterium]|nr:sulfate adenylyltransferase [Armatimonadota bacterium]
MIAPHGGRLVNRIVPKEELAAACQEADGLPRLSVTPGVASDVRNIGHGVFSPLQGFVNSQDFAAIIQNSQLTSAVAWTIPVILDISERDSVSEGQMVCLVEQGRSGPLAVLEVADVYCWDKQ